MIWVSCGHLPISRPKSECLYTQPGLISLENFEYFEDSPGLVMFDLTDGKYLVSLQAIPNQQLQNYFSVVEYDDPIEHPSYDIGQTDLSGKMEVRLTPDSYNLLSFLKCEKGCCNNLGFLEIYYQSENFLQEEYGFEKQGGYMIAERTSEQLLPHDPSIFFTDFPTMVPFGGVFPDITEFYPEGGTSDVNEAIAIMRFLWHETLLTKPNNDRSPSLQDPLTRLKMLQNGEWSVQCAELRNLFIDFAVASPSISGIRYVGLYQYWPYFSDLIPNSHAVAEFYSQSLGKWIFVDPYYGVLLRLGEDYLSTEEMASMTVEERKNISVVFLVDERRRDAENFYYSGLFFLVLGSIEFGPIWP